MDIRKILKERFNSEKIITKLSVFDFDGTLVDTPLPEYGKRKWKEVTGEEWPYKGWWGRVESLDMDVFENPTIPDVISAYNIERANKNTMVIMLTGRIPKLAYAVKSILDSYGLYFDDYLFNDGSDTLTNKCKKMTEILNDNPSIQSVHIWDDRDSHIPTFQAWGDKLVKNGRLNSFKVTHVVGNHHGETP